ncbi:MAG: TatD family hydrolase [Candidatus Pacebacteria bacterium]|nr:TatD family hydrolase [Candidatus Paceibacterota bacterium]
MEMKYIDIHSHLDFADYGSDQKGIIQRMKDSGIFTITIGTGVESSKEAVKLAEENENIYACIGNHPDDELGEIFDEKDYEELVKNPKVVAIGECGLDYAELRGLDAEKRRKKSKEDQIKDFKKQIEFAIKHNKVLMLHIRDFSQGEALNLQKGVSLGKSAYEDAYNILKEVCQEKTLAKGNIHFYAGTLEWAKKFIELGFTISFTGVITFARNYDEVIKNIPLDKIHAETDSPFVAPIPYRGKRNEPSYVIEVYKKIAEIRGEDLEDVRKQLIENAKRVFGI